uniref:E3 ubiquitin-protein ligase RNF19A n=2 Tax=Aceria tosichella TaxID=561515 RepID=A0A6G1SNV2_9ACAR
MALAVGIPLLLGYVYGVVPLSLCRSSGGCLSASPSVENLHEQFTQAAAAARRFNAQATDVVSIDTATSHKIGNPSIGETSMYMSNISLETNSIGHVTNVERDDRESASNAALAGSIFSQNADDGNSTQALAGSIISKDSGGYTLIPVEIHSHNNNNSNQVAVAATASAALATTPTTISTSNRTNELQQQSSSDISSSDQVVAPASLDMIKS